MEEELVELLKDASPECKQKIFEKLIICLGSKAYEQDLESSVCHHRSVA